MSQTSIIESGGIGPTGTDGKARKRIPDLLKGPVVGKTYSLYGDASSSDGFFETVSGVVDECIRLQPDLPFLISELRNASSNRRRFNRAICDDGSLIANIHQLASNTLGSYILDIDVHRKSLSLIDRFSKTLNTSRDQYLIYAVEIELLNRQNRNLFSQCTTRYAFLPHCLRDQDATCKAKPHGLDTICMSCSDHCYVNEVSRMLRRKRVQPYIWMSANLSKILRQKAGEPQALGILGIACIPELIAGMRRCHLTGVPVLGLPLDANRCVRWMGKFYQNTINLGQLKILLEE